MIAWMAICSLIALVVTLVIEGFVLLGRIRRFLTYAEQLLGVVGVRVADIPSKSAPRTEAPDGVQPRRWYERLRALPHRAAGAAAAPDAEIVDEPPRRTDTAPAAAAIDAWHRDVTTVMPAPDDVDAALARFHTAEGRPLR